MYANVTTEVRNKIVQLRNENMKQLGIADEVQKQFGVKMNQAEVSKILIKAGLRSLTKTKKRKKYTRTGKHVGKWARQNSTTPKTGKVSYVAPVEQAEKMLQEILGSNLSTGTKLFLVKTLVK